MPVNPAQYEVLMKGLNASRVAKRKGGGGKQLSYLEAWDVRAHLIRVFGFANWSAEVLKTDLAFEEAPGENGKNWNVGYQVILQLTVNDEWGKPLAVYSEAAVGSAQLPQRGEAHDMAIKTAESDALKRAAVNLGDQFGLSLYKDGATAPVVKMTVTHPAENAPTAPVKAPVAAEPALPVEETDPAIQYLLDALKPLETVENAGERIVGIANFKAANGAHLDEQVLIDGESVSLARYCDLIAAGAYRKYQGDEDE